MEKIQVIVVDDHQVLRQGVISMLSQQPGIELAGQACGGRQLLELLAHTPADVVLMDLNMPDMDGLQATQHLAKHFPGVKVLMLSMVSNGKIVQQLLSAGAMGYLTKNADQQEMVYAIGQVAAGKPYLGSDIALTVLSQSAPQAVHLDDRQVRVTLSKREIEVLQLLSEGCSNRQIADQLRVGKRTIDTHRQHLMDKTGSRNAASLIRYAMGKGILS